MGGSRIFNGSSGFVQIGDNSAIQDIFDGGGTVSIFLKAQSLGENNRGAFCLKINGSITSPSQGWVFRTHQVSTSSLGMRFTASFSGNNGDWELNNGINVPFNNSVQYGVTYDSSSTTSNPKFYRNFSQVTSPAVVEVSTPSGSYNSDLGTDLFIGNDAAQSSTFDGNLGCIRIWNKTLIDKDFRQEYYLPGKIIDGLVGYWPLWGDSPEIDLSGNFNTGIVSGTTVSQESHSITKF